MQMSRSDKLEFVKVIFVVSSKKNSRNILLVPVEKNVVLCGSFFEIH
jgi:hypothetical protein